MRLIPVALVLLACVPPSAADAGGDDPVAGEGARVLVLAPGATMEWPVEADADDTLSADLAATGEGRIDAALVSPQGAVVVRDFTVGTRPGALVFLADAPGAWRLRLSNAGDSEAGAEVTLRVLPPVPLGARGEDDLVLAVLDTGIDAHHGEFGPGQLVGWKDFAGDVRGQRRAVPYDDHSHGTATASLAAGLGVGTAPGAKLAVAKVMRADGKGAWEDVVAGLRWADSEMRAKVISISLDTAAPLPSAGGLLVADLNAALAAAHANGSLVVVANGNTGTYPGETHPPAWTRHALAVGATDEWGQVAGFSDHDPEVVAWGFLACVARATGRLGASPTAACMGGDARYGVDSGTSFSAPKVAGWGLGLARAALDAGEDAGPDRLDALLRRTALDRLEIPYAREGHGFVDGATVATAARHAREGTDPAWTAGGLANEGAHAASDAAKRIVGDFPW